MTLYRQGQPAYNTPMVAHYTNVNYQNITMHSGKVMLGWDQEIRSVFHEIVDRDCYRINGLRDLATVVDVGAHFGVFSYRIHETNPQAKIISVECYDRNVQCLHKNLEGIAEIVPAALCYEGDPVFLACPTVSGGGWVTTNKNPFDRKNYVESNLALTKITLEEIMQKYSLERVSLLKLDCEGCEYDLFENCTCLDKVDRIVGEWHAYDWPHNISWGHGRFQNVVSRKLPNWQTDYRVLDDRLGYFTLVNMGQK